MYLVISFILVLDLFESLGFIINYEKRQLIPNTTCKFLGFLLDSKNFSILLPDSKRRLIKTELLKMNDTNICTVGSFARVIGLLCSACPAVTYGWVHTKLFERVKYLQLKPTEDYDKTFTIPKYLHVDFTSWLNHINHSVNFICKAISVIEIYSDASMSGWGAACDSHGGF